MLRLKLIYGNKGGPENTATEMAGLYHSYIFIAVGKYFGLSRTHLYLHYAAMAQTSSWLSFW